MATDDKNTQESDKHSRKSNDQVDWKLKFNDLVSTCQSELKKTTKIGMKMLSASQSNAELHDTYEEIGRWTKQAVESGDLKIDDIKVQDLIAKANSLESELEDFEDQVHNIKKE
jgi:hypothetical protein